MCDGRPWPLRAGPHEAIHYCWDSAREGARCPYTTFVMVPVPEECVHDVVQLVARLNMQGGVERDPQTVGRSDDGAVFPRRSEEIRSLLSVVARGVLAGSKSAIRSLPTSCRWHRATPLDVMRRIRVSVTGTGRAHLVGVEVVEVATPTGRLRQKRILTMQPKIARLVRSAERTANALEQHPLEGSET